MRLVLDEHLDSAIAAELRRLGHDVVAVTEVPDLIGVSDRDLYAWAGDVGRVMVTYDVRGFAWLSAEHQMVGERAAGLIFVSSRRYPRDRGATGP